MLHNPVLATNEARLHLGPLDISKFLPIYNEAGVHLIAAEYSERQLTASFRRWQPDLYNAPLKHLSRVQIVHFVGQAAYVLVGCLSSEGLLPIEESQYIEAIKSERATFNKLQLRFRNFLPNSDGTIVRISASRIRFMKDTVVLLLDFDLNNNSCVGTAHGVIFGI